jgi:photosystem II stability/assembly factor-like uncharacterized protein
MPFCPRAPRRDRPLLLAALLLLFALATGAPSSIASANSVPGAEVFAAQATEWVLLDGTEAAWQLFAPTSGALFARTASGLKRSDDGGATWRPIELPPRTPSQKRIVVEIDPTDHTRLFANGERGLYRSTDDGMTWTLLAVPPGTGSSIRSITVSPADRFLVYVNKVGDESVGTTLWTVRSVDGGDSWELIKTDNSGPSCGYGVNLFWAHPTDPNRVYRHVGCTRGGPSGGPLQQSADRGATWADLTPPDAGGAMRIVGGRAAEPRFYLATRLVPNTASRIYESEDGVGDWRRIAEARDKTIDALADDPLNPDRLYVGTSTGNVAALVGGDQQWAALGEQAIGAIHDLVLGVDRANLYAATEQGVWRYALTPP